jgi:predicted RNase H-like nuclease (RuvC/YqgF family)
MTRKYEFITKGSLVRNIEQLKKEIKNMQDTLEVAEKLKEDFPEKVKKEFQKAVAKEVRSHEETIEELEACIKWVEEAGEAYREKVAKDISAAPNFFEEGEESIFDQLEELPPPRPKMSEPRKL